MKDIVVAAYEFAERKHANYFRKGGNVPHIVHPVAVVETLMSWGIDDADVRAAAYLHDVLEDTGTTAEEMKEIFGEKITGMVTQLTKTDGVPKEQHIANIAENAHINIGIIKYADRICNVKDFHAAGKTHYAKEYYAKISDVFSRIEREKNLLGETFEKIEKDKNALLALLNQ